MFGSHVSCQGGLLCGIERAAELGCECLQIFVCQPRQWPSGKSCIPVAPAARSATRQPSPAPAASATVISSTASESVATAVAIVTSVSAEHLSRFRAALAEHSFPSPVAHASYLINLGSADAEQWERSVAALEIEWSRAEALGLSGLVMHPGAHLESTPEEGLANIVRGIQLVCGRVKPRACRLLLENTAGQGTCLGWSFQQLGWLVKRLNMPERVGVCFDTCHAFAAGYDYSTAAKLKGMWAEFDREVGLEQLRAIHINDSQKGLGSRVDRHEHLGRGQIGETALGLFVRSGPVKGLPMFLETEKGVNTETGIDFDVENLQVLRRLAKTPRRPLSK